MELKKEYKIAGNLNKILGILKDLKYYGKLHPLILAVDEIENKSKEYEEFRIRERPYKWIPIDIKYSAKVMSIRNEVEYEIIGIPFTEANIKYELHQIEDKETQIIFSLRLEGKLIGKKILMNKMMAAQNELMKSIAEEL